MNFKRTAILLLMTSTLLSGCNDAGKKSLLLNSDYLLYGEIKTEHLFLTPSLKEFTNLYNSDLSYIVMFSDEGCSTCNDFAPIIKDYVLNTHQLVVSVNGADKYKINEEYRDKFFKDSMISTPSIFIKEKGDEIYQVNYEKYMRTYSAFSRHLSSKYKNSKSAYFCEEITTKSPIISSYSHIYFEANDTFKNKISDKIMNTEKDTLIESNFLIQSLTKFAKNENGEMVITDTDFITEEISEETISKYL